jgi:hypothetical protein
MSGKSFSDLLPKWEAFLYQKKYKVAPSNLKALVSLLCHPGFNPGSRKHNELARAFLCSKSRKENMIEVKEKQQYDLSNSLILSGVDVCNLPATLLTAYCNKIHAKLKGPNTVPCDAEQLYEAMLKGRTVLAVDVMTRKLLGFAQLKEESEDKLQFASWCAFVSGIGKPILMAGALLGYEIDPNAEVVAKVREGNCYAEKAIREMGGKLTGQETSEHHFNPNSLQPIQKNIFNISFETLISKSSCRTKLENSYPVQTEGRPSTGIWQRINDSALIRKIRWCISNNLSFKI